MPESLELYIVRHGQSQANSSNVIQGQSSTPLSELGLRQASALATAFHDLAFDAVYSSDLERAMQTAQIAVPDQTPIPCASLREWNLGVFQGLTYEEVAVRYPVEWAAFKNASIDAVVPDGESAQEITKRLVAFTEEIVAKHQSGRVLLVSHGGAIRILLRHALKIQGNWPVPPKITNASFSKFIISNDTWCLDTWNCTLHLNNLIATTGTF